MAMTIENAKCIFMHNGKKLKDPDPSLHPDEVMDLYANEIPELTNATVEGPVLNDDNEQVYTFVRELGKNA